MAEGNLITKIQQMSLQQKAVLLVTVALVVAAGLLMVTWLQKADHQLLFANLSQEDAGAIVQKLAEMKVPYTTTAGGILVPADRVYELRLQLASQGLPQGGGVGFELFDKTSFTMTDFVQKLNYRRALQGELSRTIRSLGEVEQCRVHLAVPEKSLFVQKNERPKASVMVKLRSGRKLSQGQVQGIVHLVASSVEGLDPKDVSVVDTSGEMLTAAVTDEALAATAGQMDHQRTVEGELEARILSILEPVVGKGKARAKVAAAFDFTKVERTEEKFDPDSQVVRSEQRNIEKSSNTAAGGVPGTASNLPGTTVQQSAGSRSQSDKKNETVNYEITKTVSHIVSPSWALKRLSVVVLVDGTTAMQEGAKERKYTPRSEEEIRQFEDMVKKAVGFTADRGDEVKVVNMPFGAPAVPEELGEAAKEPVSVMPIVMTAFKYVVPAAGVLLLFLFVVKPVLKILATPAPAPPPMVLPQTVAQLEQTMNRSERSNQEQLADWAKKNPKDAAGLIKGWLEEK